MVTLHSADYSMSGTWTQMNTIENPNNGKHEREQYRWQDNNVATCDLTTRIVTNNSKQTIIGWSKKFWNCKDNGIVGWLPSCLLWNLPAFRAWSILVGYCLSFWTLIRQNSSWMETLKGIRKEVSNVYALRVQLCSVSMMRANEICLWKFYIFWDNAEMADGCDKFWGIEDGTIIRRCTAAWKDRNHLHVMIVQ
jgi:hypothetical protein